MSAGANEGRCYIVLVAADGTDKPFLWAASRRTHLGGRKFQGAWGLLTEDEATELAAAINADPATTKAARVVEVFRYENDPEWPEALS